MGKYRMIIKNTTDFKEKSVNYFKSGYVCSESLLMAAYDCGIIDKKSDLDLLNRIVSPFSGEVGTHGCLCGALIGAQIIVGCLIGRKDITCHNKQLKDVSKRLADEFKAQGHAACCKMHLDGCKEIPKAKCTKCVQRIEDVIDILYENLLKDVDYISVTSSPS